MESLFANNDSIRALQCGTACALQIIPLRSFYAKSLLTGGSTDIHWDVISENAAEQTESEGQKEVGDWNPEGSGEGPMRLSARSQGPDGAIALIYPPVLK